MAAAIVVAAIGIVSGLAAAVGLKVGMLTHDLYATILLVIVGSAILPAILLRKEKALP